jgi:predicted amidohydrolase
MKIGYLQNDPIFGEKKKNFEDVRQLIKSIKTDLLVLPELFATGYTFTSAEEAKNLAEKKRWSNCNLFKRNLVTD